MVQISPAAQKILASQPEGLNPPGRMPSATPSATPTIMRAKKTAMVTDARGKRRKITKGVTTADSDAQIVQDKPHLWAPLQVDFPAEAPGAGLDLVDQLTPDSTPADVEQVMAQLEELNTLELALVVTHVMARVQALEAEAAPSEPVVPVRNPTQNLAAPDLSSAPNPKGGPPVVVTATVRKWAQEQGIPVSKSGYIAKDVIEQYIAAHS